MSEKTCEQRIDEQLRGEIKHLRKLWDGYCQGIDEDEDWDDEQFHEHGSSFDYVPAGTFEDQDRGYWRYQISGGGPSDEFRFFSGRELCLYRVEYWFLDWFDGASRRLYDDDRELLEEIWDHFKECGAVEHVFNEAVGA